MALSTQELRVLSQIRAEEHIMFCVDVGEEMSAVWEVENRTRLEMVQRALKGFVRRKLEFSGAHKFALLSFGDTVSWKLRFTNDLKQIVPAIDALQAQTGTAKGFDFSKIFQVVEEQVRLEELPDQPRALYRALIVFGRSYEVPIYSAPSSILEHPDFFLDFLYLHLKPQEVGCKCQDIFDFLSGLEPKRPTKTAYLCDCSTSIRRLYTSMGLLLAHPVQRNLQERALEKMSVEHKPNDAANSNVAKRVNT